MEYTILFVEDDEGVRESTELILAAAGFRLLVAKDGGEALRLLAENDVDVLFTDIVMPGISGIELARLAKERQPDIKVMFMTAYYPRGEDAEALGKLMFKPVRAGRMVEELTGLISSESPNAPSLRTKAAS